MQSAPYLSPIVSFSNREETDLSEFDNSISSLGAFVPKEYEEDRRRNLSIASRDRLPSVGAFPESADFSSGLTSDPVTSALLCSPQTYAAETIARTPNFNSSLGRAAKFETASPLIKEILVVLFGSRENFIVATGNPLEPFLFEFDKNLENEESVRAIGSAVGIFIELNPELHAYEIFIDKLMACILELEVNRINDAKYSNRPKMEDILYMTRKEFARYVKEEGWEESENLYQDRLNFFRYLSQTEREKAEETSVIQVDTRPDLKTFSSGF